MLIANYFIGFMICLFAVLYFVGYLILKTKKFKLKIILKKGLAFGISSLLAGGLTAFLLIPLFVGISSISATSDLWPTSQYYAFTFSEYLANHFSGVGSTVLSSGISNAANISCGILSIALAILFIVNPKIENKIKFVYLSLLLFIVVSFFYAPLDFIWHAFHVPNDLPYRYSFIYSLVLIIISAYSIINIKGIKVKLASLIYILMLILISLLYFFNYKNIENKMIILNAILITIHFILYLLYNYLPSIKKFIPYIFILTIILECTITINNNWHILQYIDEFYGDYALTREALDFTTKNDDNFYRIERTSILTFNDPSWYGYYGQATFSSMAYESMAVLQSRLGLPGNNINSYYYKQTTPVYDLMFNIKYALGADADPIRYHLFYQNDISAVFKSDFTTGLMFGVNNNIINWETSSNNPFYLQNDFIEKGTGIKNVFTKLEHVDKIKIYDHNQTIIKYTFANPGDNLYFYAAEHEIDFMVIDETIYYFNNDFNYFSEADEPINVTNYVDFNEKFIINSRPGDEFYTIYIGYNNYRYDAYRAYTIDNYKFMNAVNIFNNNKVIINEFKEDKISGHITLSEDQTIYTSIPYDEGWQVFVDNNKVQTFKIGNALLGFSVNPGKHDILLKYTPKGGLVGKIISLSSLSTLVIINVLKKKKVLNFKF